MLDKRIVFWANGISQTGKNVIMRIYRLYVQINDFLGLALGRGHFVYSINIRFTVSELKFATSLFLNYRKYCLSCPNCLIDHLFINCHASVPP